MSQSVHAAIAGVGAAVPEKVLTNQDFEKFLDTSDEWIVQRTGIKRRHVLAEGESLAALATSACQKALADAKASAADVDLIICATVSPELTFPATACLIQQGLGAAKAAAFDVSAACCGFVYALSVGSQFIRTGTYKKVLVVGADALSRYTDYTDRGSCILFGDGAGAVLLEPTADAKHGIQYMVMKSDGTGWDFIHVPGGGSRQPATHETVEARLHYVRMRGRDVYKFAVEKMQWLIDDCLEHCGLEADQIDMIVPHQVNLRILTSATEKRNFPMERVYINIDEYGNTSAASVPMALEEARREGKIGPGSTLLLVAFGAGLTWAGAVLRL